MESARILCVDDSEVGRASMKAVLSHAGYEVVLCKDGNEALARLERSGVDLVVTDLFMGKVGGQQLLQHVKAAMPHTPVIVVTGYPSVTTAVETLKSGASDYLVRPFSGDELKRVVERCLRESRLEQENIRLRGKLTFSVPAAPTIVGESGAMRRLFQAIDKMAKEDCPVLVVGESGTGKDLVARSLHLDGPRKTGPFLAVNCGAVPESLFESELFGHRKGAFTSADRDRVGLFEAASGGTLFLDEIESTSLRVQAKLLRAVEDKAIVPVGDVNPRPVDTRLIFSSQGGLRDRARTGEFRQDLYFRINVVELQIPALRERREDIPLLVEHFLARFHRDDGVSMKLSPEAQKAFLEYNWPGNVRELEHALERGALFADQSAILLKDLPAEIARWESECGDSQGIDRRMNLKDAVKRFEQEYIDTVLEEVGGDKRVAAEILEIDLSTLYRKAR